MKQFNKEQIEKLSVFENSFHTSLTANYYRELGSRRLGVIKSVYDEVVNEPYTFNDSCGHCILGFLKVVGKKYYEDKKALEEAAAKVVKALDQVFDIDNKAGETVSIEDLKVSKEPEPKAKKTTAKAPAKTTNKKAATKKK